MTHPDRATPNLPPPVPPMTIGYGDATVAIRPWSPWPLAVVLTVFTTAVMGFLVLGMPKFAQIFKDFKVELPAVTRMLIGLSEAAGYYFWGLALIPMAFVLPIAIVPHLPVPATESARRRVRRITTLVVMLLFVTALLVLLVGLFGPMLALIQSVSGPGKR